MSPPVCKSSCETNDLQENTSCCLQNISLDVWGETVGVVRVRATVQGAPDRRPAFPRSLRGGGEDRPVGWAAPRWASEKGTGPGSLPSQALPNNGREQNPGGAVSGEPAVLASGPAQPPTRCVTLNKAFLYLGPSFLVYKMRGLNEIKCLQLGEHRPLNHQRVGFQWIGAALKCMPISVPVYIFL